jgi:hypothetical protein
VGAAARGEPGFLARRRVLLRPRPLLTFDTVTLLSSASTATILWAQIRPWLAPLSLASVLEVMTNRPNGRAVVRPEVK